jgi:chromosome segregation ATPase
MPFAEYWSMSNNHRDTDPKLSGNLAADYVALQNDLQQARLLATDYQNQLCDKTNEFAGLKFVLEKTSADLERLQEHILALREERHSLANKAMRAVALEAKVAALTDELKRLRQRPIESIQVEFEDSDSVVVIP